MAVDQVDRELSRCGEWIETSGCSKCGEEMDVKWDNNCTID